MPRPHGGKLINRALPGAERERADVIRKHLRKELGYSKEDRDENIRRATYLAKLLA